MRLSLVDVGNPRHLFYERHALLENGLYPETGLKGEKTNMTNPNPHDCVEWIRESDIAWLKSPVVPSEVADRIHAGFRLAVWRPESDSEPTAWLAVTIQTGGVGFLDPPGAIDDVTEFQAKALLTFVVEKLGGSTNLMQLMLAKDAERIELAAGVCGFQFGANLLLLRRALSSLEIEPMPSNLRFEACGSELSQVLLSTYEQTQDCPLLTGKWPIEEVINGYEATGSSGKTHWRTLYFGGRAVGCVLVAVHAALEISELVYMGLVASARGQGLGAALLMEAERLTLAAGLSRMVIGVDAANTPARKHYEDAGYSLWEEKRVLLWFPKPADGGPAH